MSNDLEISIMLVVTIMFRHGADLNKGRLKMKKGLSVKLGLTELPVSKLILAIIAVIVGIVISTLTPPPELSKEAMNYLGVFATFIILMFLRIMPESTWALLMLCSFVLFNAIGFKDAFSSFSSSVVWIMACASGVGYAAAKTGLLRRIAFHVLKLFPQNYKGQVIALMAAGTVVEPLIPSIVGKVVIMAPLSVAVTKDLGFKKSSKGAAGLFNAMWISSGVIGHAFMNGSAVSFAILALLGDQAGDFTWGKWLICASIWMIGTLVISYFGIMALYKPKGSEAKQYGSDFAKNMLIEMGPMSKEEKIASAILGFMLLGFITSSLHGIDVAVISGISLCAAMLLGLFTGKEIRSGIPWETIILNASVITLASALTSLHINDWLTRILAPVMGPLTGNIYIFIAAMCLIIYFLRTFIMSPTSTMTICYFIFASSAAAAGIHPWVLMFVMSCAGSLWTLPFQHNVYVACLGATNGETVEHWDVYKMSIVYMVICLITMELSIPLWQFMGLIG